MIPELYLPNSLIAASVIIAVIFICCVTFEAINDYRLYIMSKKAKEKNLREKELKENEKKCNS